MPASPNPASAALIKKRHSSHQTQWAAQFAVASELCKRGYQVALTMGNHPTLDLMVISPSGAHFAVQVKGLYKSNWWLTPEKKPLKNLFYVFAIVPDDAPNQFYILKQEQVNEESLRIMEEGRRKREDRGQSTEKMKKGRGLRQDFVARFADWGILPK